MFLSPSHERGKVVARLPNILVHRGDARLQVHRLPGRRGVHLLVRAAGCRQALLRYLGFDESGHTIFNSKFKLKQIIHLNFRSTSSHLLTSETNCLWKLAASGLRSTNWTHPELFMLIPSRGENRALQPTKLPQLRYAAVGRLRRYEEPAFCHQL